MKDKGTTMKKTIPVVFICDEKYAMPTAVSIASIINNKAHNTIYDINVIMVECSDKKIKNIQSLQTDNVNINIIESDNIHKDLGANHSYVSKASLLKFNIANIFENYNKILYLDSDIIVRGDLSDLYNTNIKDVYAGVVIDMIAEDKNHDHDRIGNKNYFNSGMMLLNIKKIREDKLTKKFIKTKKETSSKYQDQDVLNIVFGNCVKFLSPIYNYMTTNELNYDKNTIEKFYNAKLDNIVIIHITWRKPWDYKNVAYFDLWTDYYKKSPYKNIKIKYINDKPKPKFFGKVKMDNGRRHIYLFGIKILSYKKAG